MSKFSKDSLWKRLSQKLPKSLHSSELIANAYSLSFEAHTGQERESRFTSKQRVPYIVHPIGVAINTIIYWQSGELSEKFENVVASALLHDVIEDTKMDYHEVAIATNERCAEIVQALSKPTISDDRTRSERNQIFITQIKNAGDACVYIKLCDVLHNLDRPESMPYTLLLKTLQKASGPYNALAEGYPFANRLIPVLNQRISAGKKSVTERDDIDRKYDPSNLLDYISYVSKMSDTKVIEQHDIILVLLELPGITHCDIKEFDKFDAILVQLCGENLLETVNIQTIKNDLENKNKFNIPSKHRSSLKLGGISTCIFSFPLFNPLIVENAPHVFIFVDEQKTPEWINLVSLRFLISIMSERLLGQRLLKLSSIRDEISHFGLELDPSIALRYNLNVTDLSKFRSLAIASETVRENLVRGIKKHLASHEHILNIESRSKSIESCLTKINKRGYENISEIDDIVGIRLVLLTNRTKEEVVDSLSELFRESTGYLFSSIVVDNKSYRITDVKSSDGYTATHAYFYIKSSTELAIPIACEIQFRTLYEDAWAKVSNSLSYKKRTLSIRKTEKILLELATRRNEADAILDEAVSR